MISFIENDLYVKVLHNSLKELGISRYFKVKWVDVGPWNTDLVLYDFNKVFHEAEYIFDFYKVKNGRLVKYDINLRAEIDYYFEQVD